MQSEEDLCRIRKITYPVLLLVIGLVIIFVFYNQSLKVYSPTNFLSITHQNQLAVSLPVVVNTATTSTALKPYVDAQFDILPSDRAIKINFYENEPSQGLKSLQFTVPKAGYINSYPPYLYLPFLSSLQSGREKNYQKIISVRYPYNKNDKASSWLSLGLGQSNDPKVLVDCDKSRDYYKTQPDEELSQRKIGGLMFTKVSDFEGGMEGVSDFTSYFSTINGMCYEIDIEVSMSKYPEQNGLKPVYNFKPEIEIFLNSFKFESWYDQNPFRS